MIKELDAKQTLSPIRRSVWLLLREYCLRKTREENRLVTYGEIIEKSILAYVSSEIPKRK
jgi:hypothetical protein